jgi:hypothetical protein
MRKTSPLVGLTLFVLASSARAQAPAPAAAAAPAAAPAAASPPSVAPAPAAPPAAAPAPTAPAATDAPVPALATAGTPEPEQPRLELRLAFLPMAAGKFTTAPGTTTLTADTSFTYGAGLSVDYEVAPGLTLGFAPQYIFSVKYKDPEVSPIATPTQTELDVLARIAYTAHVSDTFGVYGEALPGYSFVSSTNGTAKGLILGAGVGVDINYTKQVFSTFGVGYQVGYQKLVADKTADNKTSFVRVSLGGGLKF